jgi:hypothetical protein
MKPLRILCSILAFLLCAATITQAQTKEDIFSGTSEISWLGLDFSQAKFIGTATQFKDAGEITNSDMRDKYIPGWNQLFLDEMKKYNVADAVHRAEVKYLVEITDKSNSSFKGDFFSSNSDDYTKLDEEKIKKIVKGYDFKGKTGIGLMFFIDGMSNGK